MINEVVACPSIFVSCVCTRHTPSTDGYRRVESMFDRRGESRRSTLPVQPAKRLLGRAQLSHSVHMHTPLLRAVHPGRYTAD